MRSSNLFRTLVVGLPVALLFLSSPVLSQEGTAWSPRFLSSGLAKQFGLNQWIALTHIGLQDGMVTEFVLTFSSGSLGVQDVGGTQRIRIVTLPVSESAPLLQYIHLPLHTTSLPSDDSGTFEISEYSQLQLIKSSTMTPAQSQQFFSYLSARTIKYATKNVTFKNPFDPVRGLLHF